MKTNRISKYLALLLSVSSVVASLTNTRANIFVDGTSIVSGGDDAFTTRLSLVTGERFDFIQTTYSNTLTVSTPTFTGNGGIINFITSNGVVATEGNVTFASNRVTNHGGAFFFSGYGRVTHTGGGTLAFTGNAADVNGGALYGNIGVLTVSGSYGSLVFASNTAGVNSAGNGGAIYANDGILLNTSVSGNLDITDNAAFITGNFYGKGGAFHTNSGAIMLNNLVTGTLSISGNTANGSGGAFSNNGGGSYSYLGPGGDTVVTGSYGAILISANTASDRGGAFYAYGPGAIILSATVGGNLDIIGNQAHSGGAFYTYGNIRLNNLVGGTLNISGNTAANANGGYGGAFYTTGGAIALSGSYGAVSISSNTADTGGAFNTVSGDIIISATVSGNLDINNNIARGSGGAFYAGNNVIISVAEGGLLTASGNKADTDNAGGFAYSNSGSVVFNISASGTVIIGDNRAAANATDSISAGKGIYKQGDGMLVLNSIAYSTAYVQGGTLLIANSGEVRANVSVSGGLFRYDSDAAFTRNVTVSGGKFSYNSTQNFAGTLTFTSGTLGGTNLRGMGTLSFSDANHILAPGNSIGTLTMDGAKFTSGGVFELEIGGAALNDKLVVDTLTLSDGGFTINIVNLNFSDFNAATDYSWEFVNYSTLNGAFDSEAFTLNTGGFTGMDASRLTVSDAGGKLILSYSAVPEPSTWALLLTATLLLSALRRKF